MQATCRVMQVPATDSTALGQNASRVAVGYTAMAEAAGQQKQKRVSGVDR